MSVTRCLVSLVARVMQLRVTASPALRVKLSNELRTYTDLRVPWYECINGLTNSLLRVRLRTYESTVFGSASPQRLDRLVHEQPRPTSPVQLANPVASQLYRPALKTDPRVKPDSTQLSPYLRY